MFCKLFVLLRRLTQNQLEEGKDQLHACKRLDFQNDKNLFQTIFSSTFLHSVCMGGLTTHSQLLHCKERQKLVFVHSQNQPRLEFAPGNCFKFRHVENKERMSPPCFCWRKEEFNPICTRQQVKENSNRVYCFFYNRKNGSWEYVPAQLFKRKI